jgi:hypothetical protein
LIKDNQRVLTNRKDTHMFKIFFKGIDINVESATPKDISSLEKKMNEWLEENDVRIINMTQTTSVNERNEIPEDAPDKISPKSNNKKPQVAPSTLRKPGPTIS